MKRLNYIILTILFTIILNSNLFAQIENGSFEQWETFPFLNPTGWATLNVFVASVTQSTDAQDGSLSAKMEMAEFAGERFEPTLQKNEFTNILDARINQINFYFKSEFTNFTRLEAFVNTWDSNATTQQIIPSGSADTTIKISSSSWTLVQLPIQYFSTENIPAYFNLVFALTDSAESTDLSSVGSYVLIDNVTLDLLTDVDTKDDIPNVFKLSQNYPNPFNPSTKIEYSIPKLTDVNLSIYDILGNKVVELVDQNQAPGNYVYEFDGSSLSSGTYFVRMNAGEFTSVRKILLLK